MGYDKDNGMERRIKVRYVKVRMENSLHAALKAQAKIEKRSLNRQAEIYIEQGIKKDIPDSKGSTRATG